MAISLSKGGNVSLSKEAPGLRRIVVGLGWDARATDGKSFDLDASAFLLAEGDRVRSDADFVFYNQAEGAGGAVRHQGDNLTGDGEGDDEQIEVSLASLPAEVQKIAVSVTIHDAEVRGQNFGQVSNAYIRVANADDGQEIARYDLSEDASTETAMVFGEIYRHGQDFKFRAVGQGFAGGLAPLARTFGVNIG
jgi:tellurium resistance protein TerD